MPNFVLLFAYSFCLQSWYHASKSTLPNVSTVNEVFDSIKKEIAIQEQSLRTSHGMKRTSASHTRHNNAFLETKRSVPFEQLPEPKRAKMEDVEFSTVPESVDFSIANGSPAPLTATSKAIAVSKPEGVVSPYILKGIPLLTTICC